MARRRFDYAPIFKDKVFARMIEEQRFVSANTRFWFLLHKANAECMELAMEVYDALKFNDGIFMTQKLDEKSTMFKKLLEWSKSVCGYYHDFQLHYVTVMDTPCPLSVRDFFMKFGNYCRKAPDFPSGNVWKVDNLVADSTAAFAIAKMTDYFHSIADPSPELTRYIIQEFQDVFSTQEDFYSAESSRARVVMLVGKLADFFGLVRTDITPMRKVLKLAVNVAKMSYDKIHTDPKSFNPRVAFGFLCGRPNEDGNTAVNRIAQAVKDYEAKKLQKQEDSTTISINHDDLDLE